MGQWPRRIRGAIGMGFVWAVVWGAVGGVPRWVFGINADAPFGLIFGILGFLAGVLFSALLTATEGRRQLDQLSLPRLAGWGAASGLLLAAAFAAATSLGWGQALVIAPVFALACAASASGSLAVARRAGRHALPAGPAESAGGELTDAERRKLLAGGD